MVRKLTKEHDVLQVVPVTDETQVHHLLQIAQQQRAVAATNMNEHSSRSHSVFRLKLVGDNSKTLESCEGEILIWNWVSLCAFPLPATWCFQKGSIIDFFHILQHVFDWFSSSCCSFKEQQFVGVLLCFSLPLSCIVGCKKNAYVMTNMDYVMFSLSLSTFESNIHTFILSYLFLSIKAAILNFLPK